MMLLHLVTFVACIFLDFAFARWTREVIAHRPGPAVAWSGMFYGVSLAATVLFVSVPSTIPAAVAGHMLGTWLSLRTSPAPE